MQKIEIPKTIKDELNFFEQNLSNYLSSNVATIENINKYSLVAGKRIRVIIAYAFAQLNEGYITDEHRILATAVEVFHAATLLHDDVIDDSDLRRGKKAVHLRWSNKASILTGDYLYSKSLEILASLEKSFLNKLFLKATTLTIEGEFLQLESQQIKLTDKDEKHYFQIIAAKTAILFATTAKLSVYLTASNEKIKQQAAYKYAYNLGLCFQIMDDILDIVADPEQIGKENNIDLKQGNTTLSLLYAINKGDFTEQIKSILEQKNLEKTQQLNKLVIKAGGINYALQYAKKLINEAKNNLDFFDDGPYKEFLYQLADSLIYKEFSNINIS